MKLRFEWDEAKNKSNIDKHGLDFQDAMELFLGVEPFLVALESSEDHGEDRWKGIGILQGAIVVVVVFAERGEDTIRIISMRKANRLERAAYEKEVKKRLG
jgi:uncharacterized DUF497 family protein